MSLAHPRHRPCPKHRRPPLPSCRPALAVPDDGDHLLARPGCSSAPSMSPARSSPSCPLPARPPPHPLPRPRVARPPRSTRPCRRPAPERALLQAHPRARLHARSFDPLPLSSTSPPSLLPRSTAAAHSISPSIGFILLNLQPVLPHQDEQIEAARWFPPRARSCSSTPPHKGGARTSSTQIPTPSDRAAAAVGRRPLGAGREKTVERVCK